MEISEEGRLRCVASYFWSHNDKIINWKFDCGDRSYGSPHRSSHFVRPDYEGFTHAMSIVVANSVKADADWIVKLVQNLKEQYGQT